MSAESKYWRLNGVRQRFEGEIDKDGNVSFPPGPHRPKFPLNGNGNKKENPFKGEAVYQISKPDSSHTNH